MKHSWTFCALCFITLFSGQASAGALPDWTKPKVGTSRTPAKRLSKRADGPNGDLINQAGWEVDCDAYNYPDVCENAIDNNPLTMWHSSYSVWVAPLPHTLMIDMHAVQNVSGISILNRQDGGTNGMIKEYRVYVYNDGVHWGKPVATGTFPADTPMDTHYINFQTKPGRYVRLVAVSEINNQQYTSVAEFHIYKSPYNPWKPRSGKWGAAISLPIVPTAGFVEPTTGKVWFWGSDGTYVASWDPATNAIEGQGLATAHDMFGASTSMDGTGQIIVMGGTTAEHSSRFYGRGAWVPAGPPQIPRGWQSSATTSDGRVFAIGGGQSGGTSEKNGEIYDPASDTWTSLPNALVHPMLTGDVEGLLRSQNHAWLFGWKSGTVFQAGPSTAMNWYSTKNGGNVKSAGKRQVDDGPDAITATDPDAMLGNAVMYDAAQGKILTFGGSPRYQFEDGSANAHIITLGKPGVKPKVELAGTDGVMNFGRTYHTSVVLPDGTVFITGGLSSGDPGGQWGPQLTPEIYYPTTDTFYPQQANTITRAYNSISLLLLDGTVFNGGGCGMCGSGCPGPEHKDAQIFTPSYLIAKNGAPARRPKIISVASTVKVGGKLAVATGSAVTTASLVRYGTTSHTVNTDQRRIPLTLKRTGKNKYWFRIPRDPGIAIPGYYMLFVMNAAGTPSVSKTIKVHL
ncbi:galactose oxidase [Fusarium albosuccineum]|uniref:Galactose oxidase n=1 Tax=Fusarium albosuccineum TaxID=1237068 RepID=A0A8H4L9L1_9HYPO|nr:galactose oxidase [Fusarium albosuccineum]